MIRKLISLYGSSTNVELQQRSVEYGTLFREQDSIRAGLLERMPVPERSVERQNNSQPLTNGDTNGDLDEDLVEHDDFKARKQPQAPDTQNILDLLGGDPVLPTDSSLKPQPQQVGGSGTTGGNNILDLLGDLDLNTGSPGRHPATGLLIVPYTPLAFLWNTLGCL